MRRVLLGLLCATSSLSISASALAQDDVGAAVEAVCCGATCCLIDGMCLGTDQPNPTNPCQICDPSQSQAAWTTVDGCTPPDAGSPAEPDAGTAPPPPSGGCAAVGAGGSAPLALVALALAALLVRRRR